MIKQAVEANFAEEVEFLRALVKVPSDNPPGDCAPAAMAAAAKLAEHGFVVEQHPVPPDMVAKNGMKSATNLIVRKTFGDGKGPVIWLDALDLPLVTGRGLISS